MNRAFKVVLSTLSVAVAVAMALPAPAQEQAGRITGQLQSTFEVSLPCLDRQLQLKVYAVDTGQSKSLAFVPPIEFDERDSIVSIPSPTHGVPQDLDLTQVAELVRSGELSADTKTVVTLCVRIGDSLAIRRGVLELARKQGKYDFDDADKEDGAARLNDPDFIRSKCHVVPVRRLSIEFRYPGMDRVLLQRVDNPAFSSVMSFQGAMPAGLIERMASRTGVEMVTTFFPVLVHETSARAISKKQVQDVTDMTFKEFGKGGLTVEEAGQPVVIVNRNVANSIARDAQWSDDVEAVGDSLELLNTALELIQKKDLDIFAVTEDEMQSLLENAYDWKKIAEEKGLVELIDRLGSGETLSERDTETLRSRLEAHSKSSKGGGGISFGPIALGGGGGSTSGETKAATDQERRFARDFASWLKKDAVSGKMPLPPSLDLVRVDRQSLSKTVNQSVSIVLKSPPYVAPVSFPTNTTRKTADLDALDTHLRLQHRAGTLGDAIGELRQR